MTRSSAFRIAVPATAVLLALLLSGGASAAASCRKVSGKATIQSFSGPDCTSPVGLCATGEFTGDLAGTFAFTGTDIIPTADTPTTSVVFVIGDNTLTTRHGTILLKDAFALETTGNGDVAEVDTIIGGTGEWASATGTIRASGTFADGAGQASYVGEVCLP
jgi:hypothetical protein